MERQHNPKLSQLVVDVISPPANENQYPEVVSDRPPMFVLSFTDITYRVLQTGKPFFSHFTKSDKGESMEVRPRVRTLLDSISGEAREREMFAIMGASGSGKSTMIDALANRIAKESLQGSITLNGDILESRLLKVISAHVMQDDLLFPMLTVKETLVYAAQFRLPRSVRKENKRKRVEELIKQLGLEAATNTIIGDEGHRGVSGGERRRVSIGIDIVHDPILLFLDEPTSGLDSTSAFMVVKVLKDIARRGSIVILSIHQPSHRILSLLDRLLFLSHGQTVFYGPPSCLSMYFSEFGKPIPDKENPAEFALDLIREREATAHGAKELVQFYKTWKINHGDLFSSDKGDITHIPLNQAISVSFASGRLVSGTNNLANVSVASVGKFKNPFWMETWVLSKRAFTNSNRNPELLLVRFGVVLITGIILGTIFWRLDNTPKGVNERLGFYSIGICTMFFVSADALPVFIQERYIYMRETAHNTYRKSSFVLSNAIVSLPSLVLLSFGFACTTFFTVGLDGGMSGFLFYVATILGAFWAGSGFVTFLTGIVSHIIVAYTGALVILSDFFIFNGFFVNRNRIPDYWIWFHYMSLDKYPYQAVVQNEFSDPKKCFVRGTQMFDRTPLEVFPESTKVDVLATISNSLGLNLTSATCITNGADVLSQNAVQDLNKWNCLWITIAWGFFFRILFYILLLLGSKNKRT